MTYDIILFAGIERVNALNTIKPFGAYKCASELRKAGYSVIVINFAHSFTDQNLETMLANAVGPNTLMLGASNTYMPKFVKERTAFLKEVAKKYNPNVKIVVGGASIKLNVEYPGADYVIVGFADISIVNLANHLRHNESLRNSRRDLWGYTLIQDWDADDFVIEDNYFEWHDDDLVIPQEQTLPIEISRGCVFNCSFCNSRIKGKKNGSYIKRIDIIERELRFNYEKYGIYQYRLLDDTFNDNREKLNAMEEMVKRLPFKPKFWAFMRLDLLTKHPETIQQVVNIGVSSMAFGIETLNKKTGRVIGKGFDPESQVQTINYIKETYGDAVTMFGHFIIGLPYESIDHMLESKRRVHANEIKLDSWVFNPLWINRDTTQKWEAAFGLDLQKYGYIDEGTFSDQGYVYDRLSVEWRNEHTSFHEAKQYFDIGKFSSGNDWDVINLGIPLEKYNKLHFRDPHATAMFWDYYKKQLGAKYKKFVQQYQEYVLSYVTGHPVTIPLTEVLNII
jgi:radical SAM superfamily enzyme YgiQ (UPF0313 family)